MNKVIFEDHLCSLSIVQVTSAMGTNKFLGYSLRLSRSPRSIAWHVRFMHMSLLARVCPLCRYDMTVAIISVVSSLTPRLYMVRRWPSSAPSSYMHKIFMMNVARRAGSQARACAAAAALATSGGRTEPAGAVGIRRKWERRCGG